MTHHIDTIWAGLGALMLILSAGIWFETWRRHWKRSEMFRSAGYTLLGAFYLLLGLNLGPVAADIAIVLGVFSACLTVVFAVLIFKEKAAAGRANTPNPPATESSGPQFQGYRTTPRI